jgi:hypothetical protein
MVDTQKSTLSNDSSLLFDKECSHMSKCVLTIEPKISIGSDKFYLL